MPVHSNSLPNFAAKVRRHETGFCQPIQTITCSGTSLSHKKLLKIQNKLHLSFDKCKYVVMTIENSTHAILNIIELDR